MLVLDQGTVRRLLDVDELIDALAGGFVDLSEGRVSVPPRVAAYAGDRVGTEIDLWAGDS